MQSLQHVTSITESDSRWNLELVGALDAFRPGNLPRTATQIRDLLRKFDEPAHLAAACNALKGFGRDAASCALQELIRLLTSISDFVVQAVLVTLQSLEDDAKPVLSQIIQKHLVRDTGTANNRFSNSAIWEFGDRGIGLGITRPRCSEVISFRIEIRAATFEVADSFKTAPA